MKRTLSFLFLLICFAQFTQAQADKNTVDREIIVELISNASPADLLIQQPHLAKALQLTTAKSIYSKSPFYKISLHEKYTDRAAVLDLLAANSLVVKAQPNALVDYRTAPNDPDFRLQYGLELIGAPQVWEVSTGGYTALGDTIVVAVLDSGFDLQHEDLRENVWVNNAERIDGRDNDSNGYIDDVNGWDFINDTNDIGDSTHGTSVTGIIGAQGNNDLGVTGVNWNIKVMLFRTSQVDHIIAAYEYIIDMRRRYNETNGEKGAFIVATNVSFGQSKTFCSDQPIWGGMYDKLGEVGILTGAATDNSNYDVDLLGDMPTSCTSDFLITTTNVNETDTKHPSAAFGRVSVDMGAPGQGSYSTKSLDEYGSFGGNSAAAPHVTGAIALLYSLPCTELSRFAKESPMDAALLIKKALLEGVDPNESLVDITATGGRLNIFNSMVKIQNFCGVTTGELEIFRIQPNPTTDFLRMTFETPDFEEYTVQVFNTLGQLVIKNVITPNRFLEKQVTINVRDLPRGSYYLTLEGASDSFKTEKFIKM